MYYIPGSQLDFTQIEEVTDRLPGIGARYQYHTGTSTGTYGNIVILYE